MAVTASRITVGTSAVALNSANTSGTRLIVKNGAAVISLGGTSGVTTSTGYDMAASAELAIDVDSGDVVYAICGTSSNVQVLIV